LASRALGRGTRRRWSAARTRTSGCWQRAAWSRRCRLVEGMMAQAIKGW